MARFNFSGVAITGGTGRLNSQLGGSVLLRNGVVRNYVTPVNPQSPDQIAQRAIFSTLTTNWALVLSQSQRNAWETLRNTDANQINDPFTGTSRSAKSAKDLYILVNMNIYTATGSTANFTNDPPVSEAPGDTLLGVTTFDASAGTISTTYTGTLGTNEVHVFRFTGPYSPGYLKLVESGLRIITRSGAVSPVASGTAWQAKFGASADLEGKVVFLKVEAINDATGQKRLVGTERITIVA